MWRKHWKVGAYLIQDDESGLVRYDDRMVERWDGQIVQKSGNEQEISRHPQEFVRALDDPQLVPFVNQPVIVSASAAQVDTCIGGTNITISGPATHLFTQVNALLDENAADALLQEDGECILLES